MKTRSNWIAIFKTGTHTDSAGRTREWTGGDLDKIVSSYNPSNHEAPVVVGHPKTDAPAYGWVDAVKREGEVLYAQLKDLVPEFVQMVKEGRFKKRSISLFPDGSLRHLGWLGAKPPAVKGLPDAAFAEKKATTYEFAATDEEKAAQECHCKKRNGGEFKTPNKEDSRMSLGERLKAYFTKAIEETPADEFNEFIPKGTQNDDGKGKPASFSEADLETAKKKAAKEAREKVEAEFAENAKKERVATRKKEIADFCEKQAKEGKIIPAWIKGGLPEFMESLVEDETEISFAEGQEKKSKLDWFKDFMEGLPKVINFTEFAGKDKDVPDDAGSKLMAFAEKKQEKEKISFGEAWDKVLVEHKELAEEYAKNMI
jgi:hypothetical protein